MRDDLGYVVIFLAAVLMSSISQILLKKSAEQECESRIKEYLNIPVIVAYGLLFCSSLVIVLAYRGVPLNMGPVLEATGYIWVSILGVIFLKEHIKGKKILGLIVIIIGIFIFNIS